MPRFHNHKAPRLLLLSSLPWALSSAVLLTLAHVDPELWFVSLFALIPFLWRACSVSWKSSVALGVMLATGFVITSSTSLLLFAPKAFCLKLISLNIAFALFSLAVNRLRRFLGFDPLMIAFLWFPIEYILIRYANLDNIFFLSDSGPRLLLSFSSLFGILLGSLVIVLGNSLIMVFARYAVRNPLRRSKYQTGTTRRFFVYTNQIIVREHWYCLPNRRAPPLSLSFKGL